ncbi:MAG TPA: YrdB family protein [Hanamia sp.]|nr:YrdB family protein [Hanamia sp.]
MADDSLEKQLELKPYIHVIKLFIMKVNAFKTFNLFLAFLLETVLFISVGNLGFNLSENIVISIFLCVILPMIAIYCWGTYQSSKSPRRLEQPHRFIVAILGFSAGATAFNVTGKPILALTFIILAFINQLILFYMEKRDRKGDNQDNEDDEDDN